MLIETQRLVIRDLQDVYKRQAVGSQRQNVFGIGSQNHLSHQYRIRSCRQRNLPVNGAKFNILGQRAGFFHIKTVSYTHLLVDLNGNVIGKAGEFVSLALDKDGKVIGYVGADGKVYEMCIRDSFHFDEIDFQNVKPYEESRKNSEPFPDDDFLDYGGEIPEIWKWMLKDHAFVETEFQLEPALNKGCTLVTFFRGGYMPCKAINSNIVIDVNEKGGFVRGLSLIHIFCFGD